MRVILCFAANLDCCVFEIDSFVYNCEIVDLIGEAQPQIERFFESVNQASITL